MSKLRQFGFYSLVLALTVLVSRAAYNWQRLVSDPIDALQACLIVGLGGGALVTIALNLPIGRRAKK